MAEINPNFFNTNHYALAPELLLTPQGPKQNQVLVVSDGQIETVTSPDKYQGNTLTLPGRAIIPGFVDAHTHLGQTFGKALIGGEPSQIWKRIWYPMEDALDVHSAYISAKWLFLEAMRGGFTTIVNFNLNDSTKNVGVHQAAEETGIRLISATGLNEYSSDSGTGDSVHSVSDIIEQLKEHIELCDRPRLIPSLCCGAFEGNRPETLAELSKFCAQQGILFQMHSNEHFPEVHECVVRFGKRPIEMLSEFEILGSHVLLHHTTLVSETEIELLHASNTATSYNPLASLWKGNAVMPALHYASRGIRFGIGSDSTSSDAFRSLTAAEACQRIQHAIPVDDFSCGAGWTWVEAATHGSADACGEGSAFGHLHQGMAADFLILDMLQPECLPSCDFEWELVRYYNRDQIEAVVIDGILRMKGGRPVGWNDQDFINDNLAIAKSINTAEGIKRVHGPSINYRMKSRELSNK